ncbi:phosphatidylinositol-3,5-bisphosphate 3-phosphatase MTMR14 isoform 9 [Homo sapiens]|uniref:phosphatidylinositol-3,5-bisphosphate 3-phosphatase MTMR14 isoform 9 n=1 Tax=Homo sapiens TaxID=9606 RepID=UPI0007DC6385|nr:myotubularin-related protein 14 isoform 9 [Homo sapiens]|eukprot:XP_016862527.1 myotubularin-related protein 14 isoform X6 [Homo sapiens]
MAGARAAAAAASAGSSASSGNQPPQELGLGELLEEFSRTQYRAKDGSGTGGSKVERIEKRCLELFGRDYCFSVIPNTNGDICGHYPRHIVFLEYESSEKEKDTFESTVQVSKLQDLIHRSKMARCRGRFVCPVILFKGKHICRSATLAGWGELYGRSGYNYFFSGGADDAWADVEDVTEEDCALRSGDTHLFDKVRGYDIKLLRYLSVKYICDLMVENKKVKFGMNVTSSEKVDKAQRYADFTLLSIPYPGCEFFKEYKDRDYMAEGLIFNWKQCWDLVQQTQNYLKLLLSLVNSDDDSGLLVHCISGWDRTPLFISLLRLSLWADGLIHTSLKPTEILYLTVAYDWFLFGHMLVDRLSKGEEIFFFCFNFLKHITSEEFSALKTQRRKSLPARDGGFTLEDICMLRRKDRGSTTSLGSDFSLVMESSPGATGSFTYEAVELVPAGAPTQAAWRKSHSSSPQSVLWNRPQPSEDRLPSQQGLAEARSSSSSSSNHSDNFFRMGSSPLEVPKPRLAALSDRETRLQEVRSAFLAAYSSTVGLRAVAPSPSGAIGGLLEQFARGVGLRSISSNAL